MEQSDIIKNACVDQFWEGIKSLVSHASPQRVPIILAGITAARLTDTNTGALEHCRDQLAETCDGCVTYAKSFKRITGRSITVADIVSYRDKDALLRVTYDEGSDSNYGFSHLLRESDITLTDQNIDDVWKAIDACCVATRTYFGMAPGNPEVPTRDAIAREIKMHKDMKKNGAGSTLDAARVSQISEAFTELFQAHDMPEPQFGPEELSELDDLLGAPTASGVTVIEACAKGDFTALVSSKLGKKLSMPNKGDNPGADPAWTSLAEKIERSHGLFKMKGNIPQNMMSTIEKSATRLAANMSSGQMPTNVMDIGQDIINQCSAEDLQQLAGNIHNLVPDLKKVYDGMQGQGIPPMDPAMGNMMDMLGGMTSGKAN